MWRSKVEPLPEEDPEETESQERGNLLEAVVVPFYERKFDRKCFLGQTWPHPAYDWWMATPDRISSPPHGWIDGKRSDGTIWSNSRILEVKTRDAVRDWSQVAGDPVDLDAQAMRAQIIWQLGVVHERFGISTCDLAVLGGHYQIEYHTIERDEKLEATLRDICGAWWQKHVVERVPPPPDASEEYGRWLGSLPHGKKTLVLPKEHDNQELEPLRELVRNYLDARWQAKAQEEQFSELANKLRHALLEIDVLDTPWGRFRYQSVNGHDKTDWEAVARRFMGMLCSTGVAQDPLKKDMVKACEEIVRQETKKTKGHRALVPPKQE